MAARDAGSSRIELDRIRALRRGGDPRGALDLASKTIYALRPRRTTDVAGSQLFLERGRICEVLGDELGAEADFARAATVSREGDPTTSVAALAGLARIGRSRGRYDDVREHLAAIDRLSAFPVKSVARTEALTEIGWLAMETGADAVAAFDRAITLAASASRDAEAVRAAIGALVGRATALRSSGHFARGRDDLQRALALAESTFGPDAYEVAETLDAIGVLGKFAGDFDRSEAAYGRAAAILRRVVGEEHPDMAAIYHNLAGLAHARGDATTAEPLARRSVEIRERTLGPDHLATVLDRAGLAAILDALGRDDEAAVMLTQALADLERIVGPDHREVAVTLNNLAAIDQRRGDLVSAEARYRRALEIKERTQGPTAPALASTLNNLGTVLRRQERLDEARDAYDRAIALLDDVVDDDHPTLMAARRNRGRLEPGPDG